MGFSSKIEHLLILSGAYMHYDVVRLLGAMMHVKSIALTEYPHNPSHCRNGIRGRCPGLSWVRSEC
jgi:hypothetical protein